MKDEYDKLKTQRRVARARRRIVLDPQYPQLSLLTSDKVVEGILADVAKGGA